ncbi:hypothetical protein OSTOST_10660, partial [Ostertagia ostertagi]
MMAHMTQHQCDDNEQNNYGLHPENAELESICRIPEILEVKDEICCFPAPNCATVLGHARQNDEGCPREECHRAQPRPKFLHHVGIKARLGSIFTIVRSGETIAKQDEQILDWAKKYGVEEEVEEFNNKTASYVEELKQNVTNLIAELPTALEAFLNITQNKDQTRMEMKKALREMRTEEFEVFDALKAAFNRISNRIIAFTHRFRTDSKSSGK